MSSYLVSNSLACT
ncbi:hypothetical protein Zm00014a_042433 [Zea mays]|uniref:Uncharacterized protein n=1 Tax=Zea mays TaxID=4577 RepID=A0A3L6E263_MAIZE|nr:hypothetical protein Zm00014a_042432 [Zea mays]PWZ14991.1 hypothetical protein Zm00014a_042433 [Zea mays]